MALSAGRRAEGLCRSLGEECFRKRHITNKGLEVRCAWHKRGCMRILELLGKKRSERDWGRDSGGLWQPCEDGVLVGPSQRDSRWI